MHVLLKEKYSLVPLFDERAEGMQCGRKKIKNKNLYIWKIKNEKGQENGELETIQRGNQSHSETDRI